MYETVKQEIQNYMEEKRSYLINFLKKMIFFDSRTLDSGRRGREEGLQKFVAEKLMSIGANRVDVFEPDNEAIKDLPGFQHSCGNRCFTDGNRRRIYPSATLPWLIEVFSYCHISP
mgnify:CR=1 FL=1